MRKFISIKYIIESVFRDLDLEREPNWLDWIEWSAEALDYINASMQYVIKSTDNCDMPVIEITCHKGKLPADFYAPIEPIMMNGKALLPQNNAKIYASYVSASTQATYNNTPVDATLAPRIVTTSESNGTDYYTIIDDCIYTSIPSGTLNLDYFAIPLDEDGYPKIPDTYFYREAIKAYITYRLYHPKWLTGSITDRVFYEVKNRWVYLSQAARAEANSPSVGEMEKLKRQWIRLIPNLNAFDKGFRDLNSTQNLNLNP